MTGETELTRATAQAIRKLRKDAKLTQKQVAERAGLSKSWLSRLESGKHETTWVGLKKIARGLGVPGTILMCEIERQEQN